jgi:hypothetical protein
MMSNLAAPLLCEPRKDRKSLITCRAFIGAQVGWHNIVFITQILESVELSNIRDLDLLWPRPRIVCLGIDGHRKPDTRHFLFANSQMRLSLRSICGVCPLVT